MKQGRRFPLVASILSSDALTQRVLGRYALDEPVRCRFFHHGVNDTFQVHAGRTRYFLRVYRAGWRTKPQIAAELDMLLHLRDDGIAVSSPIQRKDGRYMTRVDAAEGVRWAVLFTAAAGGRVPPTLRNCSAYGELVARIHTSLDRRPRDPRRFDLDRQHLIDGPLQHLERVLEHRPADLDFLRDAGAGLGEQLESLPRCGPQYGNCHGDHHGGNVHADDNGHLTLFDFDCYGYGWRAYDLAVYLWQASLKFGQSGSGKGRATRRWNVFLEGYETVRTLDAAERDATRLFVPIRHLWLMGLHAQGSDVWGNSWMQDPYFDRQVRFVRGWVDRYGLL